MAFNWNEAFNIDFFSLNLILLNIADSGETTIYEKVERINFSAERRYLIDFYAYIYVYICNNNFILLFF
jgi:hypothetical protein